MNFSLIEHGWKKQNVTGEVSADVLQVLIQHNKNQEKIKKLHGLSKDDPEYDIIKQSLPCVKPHGTFSEYAVEENFLKFSGFIFFDIDSGDMEQARQSLLSKHADKIYMLGKSVGGKGLFFYMKIANPSIVRPDNFLAIQNYFIKDVFNDIEIDLRAKGICRNQVIPYDKDLYVNENAIVSIPNCIKHYENRIIKGDKKCNVPYIKEGEERYIGNVTLTYIEYNTLCKELVLETPVDFPNDEKYIIKEIDFVKVPIWRKVTSGCRHNFFKWQINALMYLNPGITLLQVESFINFWNKHMTDVSLDYIDMTNTVRKEYKRLKDGGTNIAKIIKKKVHTNPAYKNRVATANQAKGIVRKSETMFKIRQAILELIAKDEKLNKKKVAELCGISRQAVTRYWEEVVNDLDNPWVAPDSQIEDESVDFIQTALDGSIDDDEALMSSDELNDLIERLKIYDIKKYPMGSCDPDRRSGSRFSQ